MCSLHVIKIFLKSSNILCTHTKPEQSFKYSEKQQTSFPSEHDPEIQVCMHRGLSDSYPTPRHVCWVAVPAVAPHLHLRVPDSGIPVPSLCYRCTGH